MASTKKTSSVKVEKTLKENKLKKAGKIIENKEPIKTKKVLKNEKVSKHKVIKAQADIDTVTEIVDAEIETNNQKQVSFSTIIASLISLIFIISFLLNGFLYYYFNKESVKVKDDLTASKSQISELQTKLSSLSVTIDSLSKNQPNQPTPAPTTLKIEKPDTNKDHWIGNKNAKFVWVVYTDFQCPFCSKIHPDIKKLTADFPEIALVYRNYPLSTIHPNALKLAESAECVSSSDGNDMYWKFVDLLFEKQATITIAEIPNLASTIGIQPDSLKNCLDNGLQTAKVNLDLQKSNTLLGSNNLGTPTSVLYNMQNDNNIVISGALPYDQLKQSLQDFTDKNK